MVKVLTVPGKDKILGATIVGEHAGDLIAEFILAMKHGLGLNKILGTIHIYPTLAEANKYAAGAGRRRTRRRACCAAWRDSTRGCAADPRCAAVQSSPAARSRQGFDHSHPAWDALLKKHVVVLDGGKASQRPLRGRSQRRARCAVPGPAVRGAGGRVRHAGRPGSRSPSSSTPTMRSRSRRS